MTDTARTPTRDATDEFPSRAQQHIIDALSDKYAGASLAVENYMGAGLAKVTCPDVIVFVGVEGERVSVSRSVEERRVYLIESITAKQWDKIAATVAAYYVIRGDLWERLKEIARLTREIEEQA